jgi:hypothetical protein
MMSKARRSNFDEVSGEENKRKLSYYQADMNLSFGNFKKQLSW